jgi:TonB family protein
LLAGSFYLVAQTLNQPQSSSQTGKVEDVKVIKSLDRELDANAVRTVRTWKFRRATKDGQPAAVHITVMVSFQLQATLRRRVLW